MSRATHELVMPKTADQFRGSPYHQQLGRKLCASFVAQQQGIGLDPAFRKVPESVGDFWLILAELVRQGGFADFSN